MSLKIYFCGSIMGGRQDASLYSRLIRRLEQYGEVLTKVVGQPDVIELEKTLIPENIHDQDMQWLQEADVVIAEVTQASIGVGYEIGRAIGLDKRILCLHRPESGKHPSAMIAGCRSLQFTQYTEKEVDKTFEEFFTSLGGEFS